jgi:hypothetical protein
MSPERSVKDLFGPYTDCLAEDTVTSELLSVTNREKYRETSAEIINLSHVGAGSAHPSVS